MSQTTTFRIGPHTIEVPVLSLRVQRLTQRMLAKIRELGDSPDDQDQIVDCYLMILAACLKTTAKNPAEQGQIGAETWEELTVDRMLDLIEGFSGTTAVMNSMRDLIALSSGRAPGESAPAETDSPLPAETPKRSSTRSLSPSRAKGSRVAAGTE